MQPIKQKPPVEVYSATQSQPDAILLDVRSVEEFEQGHPSGAYNIPIFQPQASTGQMEFNQDFFATLAKHFTADQTFFVSCKSGMRSLKACEVMMAQGFEDATNVAGGFHGDGQTSGWAECDLPSDTEAKPGRTYQELLRKAGLT